MSTFNTERMKELVSYAIQGAGFDKVLALTEYMGVSASKGTLYLNTTNGTNYVRVQDACVGDDFNVTVDAELFSKLISKINTDTFDMTVSDSALTINTDKGKYTLELKVDEMGSPMKFPDKFPSKTTDVTTIPASALVTINTSLKASLANVVGNVYSNYYAGNVFASTDKAMMNIFNVKLFDDAYLFNREFISVIASCNADAKVSKSDDMILAECAVSEKCTVSVCTIIDSSVKDFNTDNVEKFAGFEVNSFCRFKKAEMLELLDRLALFVSKFDDGAIQLKFTTDGIEVSSIGSSGVESVAFTESKDAVPFTIKINIDRLRNQLKVYSSDIVDLYYGSDICIKLVDGDIMQVIALIK